MLKWTVKEDRYGFKIVTKKEITVQSGLTKSQAEQIAAAHNAVIDQAFDGAGSVR